MRALKGGMADIVREYAAKGWLVAPTKNQHVKFTKPGCQPVFCSGTPSDQRALRNIRAMLRRADEGRRT